MRFSMLTHSIKFSDKKAVTINPDETYTDEKINALLECRFDKKYSTDGREIHVIGVLPFYRIRDISKASENGRRLKDESDTTSKIILSGILEGIKERPLLIATALNGGMHYQGLILDVQKNNSVNVTILNSIDKSMSQEDAIQEAREELYILEMCGLKINKITYKQPYLQNESHDCGPVTLLNLESELLFGKDIRNQHAKKTIEMRARDQYQFQYKTDDIPKITMIDDVHTNADVGSSKGSITPAYKIRKTSKEDLKNKIVGSLCELYGKNDNIEMLANLSIKKFGENVSLEEHLSHIVSAISNNNDDLKRATRSGSLRS